MRGRKENKKEKDKTERDETQPSTSCSLEKETEDLLRLSFLLSQK